MARFVRPLDRPLRVVDARGLPASKSHVQRALVLATFEEQPWRLRGAGWSGDIAACADACRAFGAGIERVVDDLEVVPGALLPEPVAVTVGASATTARMLGAVAASLGLRVRLDGGPQLRARPFGPLVATLREVGVRVDGDALPLEIDPRAARWPLRVTTDARLTSQVASGLVLGAALRRVHGLGRAPEEVMAEGIAARGYLAMTVDVAAWFGHDVEFIGDALVRVGPRRRAAPGWWDAPQDASSFAFPTVLAAVHGVEVDGAPGTWDRHPDGAVPDEVARIASAPGDVRVDVGAFPDAFPALAVLAATRPVRTELAGAPSLRVKESDRVAALAAALRACGVAEVRELPDGLVVRGPLAATGTTVELPASDDHRVVMATSLFGTVLREGVRVVNDGCVAKSWPGFWDWLAAHARLA